MLHAQTNAKGALFNIKAADRRDNGPVMSGNFEVNAKKINVAAFLKISRESGKDYLNLKIGTTGGPVFYGRLFRNDDKLGDSSPDYSGYVELGTGRDAPQLRIAGWKVRPKNQSAVYISLDIAPPLRSSSPAKSEPEDEALPL